MSEYNSIHTGQEIDNFKQRIITLENNLQTANSKITTLENKHEIINIIPTWDTNYITSFGGGHCIYQIGDIIIVSLNIQTNGAIPSGTILATGMPPAKSKSQIISNSNNSNTTPAGRQANLWVTTNGEITNDGVIGLSSTEIWFDGTGTYVTE